MLEFRVHCDSTKPGEHVAVLGAGPLGNWQHEDAVILDGKTFPVWQGEVAVGSEGKLEFKYIIATKGGLGDRAQLVKWEFDGKNRTANPGAACAEKLVLHHFFGDASRSTVEVIQMEGAPPLDGAARSAEILQVDSSKPSSKTNSTADTRQSSPPARNPRSFRGADGTNLPLNKVNSFKESVLDGIEVDANIRFGRLKVEEGAFDEKYELRPDAVLGTGMSGGVVVALDRKTNTKVAVKSLSLEGLSGQSLEQVLAEVQNQLTMDHPNICRLLEVYEEPTCLRLVMERMRGPDLFVHLSKKGKYTERDAGGCVRQMTSAVAYCHRRGVCHRDLKLDNFCLEDNSEDARVKLIDFGLSSVICSDVPMTNACGTLYYVAPEVLGGSYDKKCDMWSLGVIVYILLDGRAPFMGKDDRATFLLIKRGTYRFPEDRWNHISGSAKDFVSQLLQVDVKKRLGADEALEHGWLLAALAVSIDEDLEPLDASVLQGMKTFTKSNALKRAVLRAVAPIATPDQVARWADEFEALDTQGTGEVLVQDLAKALSERAQMSEAEVQALCEGMAGIEGETISYSAFLAACLSAHTTIGDDELRDLWDKLDHDADDNVSVEDVVQAFGDIVDAEELKNDFGDTLSFDDFRWIMSMPRFGPTKLGMKHVMEKFGTLEAGWKNSTKQAKRKNDADAAEAARRENMAWRVWNRQIARGEVPEEMPGSSPRTGHQGVALSLDSILMSRGYFKRDAVAKMTVEEKRAAIITDLVKRGHGSQEKFAAMRDEDLALAAFKNDGAEADIASDLKMPRTATFALVTECLDDDEEETQAAWAVATAAAKDGCIESARRENMHWRKMHMAKAKSEGLAALKEASSKESFYSTSAGV